MCPELKEVLHIMKNNPAMSRCAVLKSYGVILDQVFICILRIRFAVGVEFVTRLEFLPRHVSSTNFQCKLCPFLLVHIKIDVYRVMCVGGGRGEGGWGATNRFISFIFLVHFGHSLSFLQGILIPNPSNGLVMNNSFSILLAKNRILLCVIISVFRIDIGT